MENQYLIIDRSILPAYYDKVIEARSLVEYRDRPALNTVGYKELFGDFDGEYDLAEAVRLIKRNTRHYAKKQMTYWRRDSSISWIDLD